MSLFLLLGYMKILILTAKWTIGTLYGDGQRGEWKFGYAKVFLTIFVATQKKRGRPKITSEY